MKSVSAELFIFNTIRKKLGKEIEQLTFEDILFIAEDTESSEGLTVAHQPAKVLEQDSSSHLSASSVSVLHLANSSIWEEDSEWAIPLTLPPLSCVTVIIYELYYYCGIILRPSVLLITKIICFLNKIFYFHLLFSLKYLKCDFLIIIRETSF